MVCDILNLIDYFSKGDYEAVFRIEHTPLFENNEDKVIYNLIYIGSCIKTSREIPQEILANISKVEKPQKDYIFLETAKYYLKRGDYKKAEGFIEKVNFSQLKSNPLLYDSLRLKAQIYEKQNLYEKESLAWNAVQEMSGIKSSRKQEAAFKKAIALKKAGCSEKAKNLFKEIAFDSQLNPFGSFALREFSVEELKGISDEKKLQFAKDFLRIGRSKDAVLFLKLIDEKKRDASIWADALYRSRQNQDLFDFCDTILRKTERATAQEISAVLKGLWATLRTGEIEKGKKYFEYITRESKTEPLTLGEANYAMGSLLFGEGKFSESINYFEKTSSYEKNKYYYNAIYKNILSKYIIGEKEIQFGNLISKDNPFRERALFLASDFMNKDINLDMKNPSIYSAIKEKDMAKKIALYKKFHQEKLERNSFAKDSFAQKLYRCGFLLYALNEIEKRGEEASKEDKYAYKTILAQSGNFCKEFSEIDQSIVFSHPSPFWEEISEAAAKYGMEKSLMYAICRNESRFDPYAYSTTGAIGLFQIMPETAKFLLGREIQDEELFEPQINAEIAALYIKKLKGLFSSDAMVISSYNAGEDVVLRWKNNFPDNETLFILMIPYFETQNYTELVLFDKIVYEGLLKE
ncbi:MAG: lytic transglycosylase domain-containing protein [Acidobacteria bacterium]|nr:lytic transglycosylase domain-containing protein [Acidobacteriota bacterium]